MNNRRPQQTDTYNRIMKVGKRIAFTIICTIPFVLAFGYLTRNVIKKNWLQILCFMAIFGLAVLIVEIITRKTEKQKQQKEIVEGKKDVFK